MKTEIKILENKEGLGIYAADLFAEMAEQHITAKGRFNVALSGGSTPRVLYEKLVQLHGDDVHWSYIDFFWSDERFVPFEHESSNGGMAYRYLLQPLQIEKSQFYPVPTEDSDPHRTAMQYEQMLRAYFDTPVGVPAFDLIFLGLGDDGHTASLFPGTQALTITNKLVVANWVQKFTTWRITFTTSLLNKAKNIIFLVSGPDKAQVAREIITKKNPNFPASMVKPDDGTLIWLLDKTAAAEM